MPFKDPEKQKEKQKEYAKNWYLKNKDKCNESSKINKAIRKQKFREYKATLCCSVCGENHPAALDFHHHTPHPDNKKISELASDGRYVMAIREIKEKCIVLCASCHRKHHYNEGYNRK